MVLSFDIIENQNFNCSQNITNNTILSGDPYEGAMISCDRQIGFTKWSHFFFLSLALWGLITNSVILFYYFRRKYESQGWTQASMKRMFIILSIVDIFTCFYWILSSQIFKTAGKIKTNYKLCYFFSVAYMFVFTFDFLFLNTILYQFRKINENPIEGIWHPDKNIFKYLSFSIIIALIQSILTGVLKVYGRSPLVTCFIKTEYTDTMRNLSVFLSFLIPLLSIFGCIVQIYLMFFKKFFMNDTGLRKLFLKNIYYSWIYCCWHIPWIITIIITIINTVSLEVVEIIRWIAFYTSILSCGIPLISSLVRAIQGFTRIDCISKFYKRQRLKRKVGNYDIQANDINVSLSQNGNNATLDLFGNNTLSRDELEWLERHVLQFFIRDIFIGISYCINQERIYDDLLSLNNIDNLDTVEHNITPDNFNISDRMVEKTKNWNVKFYEYAPKSFTFLRKLEGINQNEMLKSFLPMMNQTGIRESQGKSGSFFISTDDNRFMIKTLKVEEFELIRHSFLTKYVQFIQNNPKSLLCRIYGMYKIVLYQETEVWIIIMRNVIGEFTDNIWCKFDLKGSKLNRKESWDNFDIDKGRKLVMKDLNFDEIERVLQWSRSNIDKIRTLTSNDSKFWQQQNWMDYSLFVVKLTLSIDQSEIIFGKRISEKQEKEVSKWMSDEYTMNNEVSLNESSCTSKNLELNSNDIQHYKWFVFPSLKRGQAYIIAIIDYLQWYNNFKYVETNFKYYVRLGKDISDISCVNPEIYSERFINFVKKITEVKRCWSEEGRRDSK